MTYDELVAFTVAAGCDENQVRAGSMPPEACETVANRMPLGWRSGLYVGSFVGVGLAHTLWKYMERDGGRRSPIPGQTLLIDPNIPHRGVERPLDVATALFCRCGFSHVVTPMVAFSRGENETNDGMDYGGPRTIHKRCGSALQSLHFARAKFDWILLDGHHDADHVKAEIEWGSQMLRPGGLLFLDDIDDNWPRLKALFDPQRTPLFHYGLEVIAHEGRVGVAKAFPRDAFGRPIL